MVSSNGRTWIRWIGFRAGIAGIALLFSVTVGLLLFAAPAAFAAGGSCPTGANYINPANPTEPLVTLASFGITSCFYASKSAGADTNAGTTEAAPWAHIPGMASCTGTCASTTPGPGEGFILKGGDHWVASDMPVVFVGTNGTSGSPIYIGVDLTWSTGSSWARPIFDCQSTQCGSRAQTQLNTAYTTIDYIESTGLRFITETQKGVEVTNANDVAERMYFHGWSHDPSWGGAQDDGRGFTMGANGGTVTTFRFNVADGSDTSKDMMGGADDSDNVYDNVFEYVYNGVRGHHNDVHGNLIAHLIIDLGGDHANGISVFGPSAGFTTLYIYNNVITDDSLAAGSEILWAMSNGNYTGDNSYIYNNVLYNVGRGIDVGDHPSNSGGTFWIYNNTITPNGLSYCFGNGETPPRNTLNYANNHCIDTSTTCLSTGVTCNNLGGNLVQTFAQANSNLSAHFDQYTKSETFVYSPLASTNSTVGAGNNLTSSCSGNVAALCSDTTYPIYDAVNHVVVMRTVKPRPANGAWDIGAYEYSSAQGSAPSAPTGLAAVVH